MSESEMINSAMDRAEAILDLLENTFGDDPRVDFASTRYNEIISSGAPLAYALGTTYLEWCVANPGIIGKPQELFPCQSKCTHGWIIEDAEEQRYKPCPRCLTGAYDLWMADWEDLPPGDDFDDDEDDWNGPDYRQQSF